jgi:mannose-6-phosphate isomerase-like protein (cupin superfamily)
MKAINILQKFELIDSHWHPHQVAIVDDMQVILAKIKGEFVWHKHEREDELFQVISGTLHMQFRDRTEVVGPGEIIVVPKGVEHCPATANGEEVLLLLFEKKSTAHTGQVEHELTRSVYPKI